MSEDGSVTVDLPEEKPKKKKVKSKKITKTEKPVKKKKAAAKDKPKKAKARTRIDIESGTRKEIKVAEAVYDFLVEYAESKDLKSAGEAADRIISIGISRKKALDAYAKRVAKGEVGGKK